MRKIDVSPPGWTPPRVRLILLVLGLIFVLNVFDVCATLVMTGIVGASEEMNPLMRWALEQGPAVFIATKMTLVVGLTSTLAWLGRRRRFAWIGLCAIAAVYGTLVAYQFAVFFMVPPPGFR